MALAAGHCDNIIAIVGEVELVRSDQTIGTPA